MTTTRHFGMDWLRIAAFALLILYHVGMYFVPWDWHVKIAQPLDWVQVPMLATNSWRLPLLFLVSGYASAALFAKLGGSGAFVRSRSARLLIPLVFGILVVIPPQPWIELVTQHGYGKSLGAFWTSDYFRFGTLDGIVLPTWQHLWFVVYLWVYTMLAAAVLAWVPVAARAKVADGAARWLGGWGLLVLPLALWLLLLALFPDHDETHALFDDGPSHLHYLMPFFVGWLLRVRPALFAVVARWWRVSLGVAVAAFAVVAGIMYLWLSGSQPPEWGQLPFDIAHQVQGWATIVALVGIADAYWNRDHPQRAMLAEAVFPFLHHPPDDHRRRRLVSAAGRGRGVAVLPDPRRRDDARVLAFLLDRAQHRLAATADRIAAKIGGNTMGALKGILAIVGVAAILVGGLWALQGLDIIRWPASSFMLGDTTWTRNGVVLVVVGIFLVWFARRR